MSSTDESYRKHFGERLAAARKLAGMNQAQLSDSVDIGRATLSRYERGDLTPPTDVLASIAAFLQPYGVSLEWLLYGEEEAEVEAQPTARLRSFGSLVALRFTSGGVGEVSMGLPEVRRFLQVCRELEQGQPKPSTAVLESIDTVIEHFYEHYDEIDIVADVPIAVHGVKLTPVVPVSTKREDLSKWSVARGMEPRNQPTKDGSGKEEVRQNISGEGHQIAGGNIENSGGVSIGRRFKD
ncbi:hypothetical protein GCM10007160_25340 [Litchfieldella qijiaojingensis]|uniref:HTH cro/C1-type domain-containing protein n=1 Tax=Litchfieldella qijiaojingensis TaxID=980347 RepID=A0ABQ2YYZ0_9GAMM|nr:helix-turn-helix transcriptional regulator [Halomonas qijiaojingensis]GGX96649.1 hypothetical protein GCM10007160_25340 [Halomonas qijiaojingensis]